MAKDVFNIGPNVLFNEGGVAMRSRHCPVRQYNKDEPDEHRVDFFIMSDATYYLIFQIDVHQGKKQSWYWHHSNAT